MRVTTLKEQYDWEPVSFDVKDILLLLKNAVMAELVARIDGQYCWIGVACPYDRKRQLFEDQVFYIDGQEFKSLEELIIHAVLGGQLFADISEPLRVIDTLEGDPAVYVHLAAELKKDFKDGV